MAVSNNKDAESLSPTSLGQKQAKNEGVFEMKKGNSKFRATWHTEENKSAWGLPHWLIHILGIDPLPPNLIVPKFAKDDKMPFVSEVDLHRWILPRALIPFAFHWTFTRYTGITLHFVAAFLLYTFWFKAFGVMLFRLLRRMSTTAGFLDSQHPRDGIPDQAVGKVWMSLVSTSTYRPMLAVMLAYDRNAPVALSFPWFVVYLGLYNIALDFWFYFYHRAMHEVPFLWRFHKTHHLTKHPNPTLTLFADEVQETFDIAVIPCLAHMTMRLFCNFNFYDWWLCSMYQVFTELSGHCGMRLYATSPSTFGLLQILGLEIVIEDHDLHHRQGWRKSGNYGKQSMLFDRLFGTKLDREETIPENMAKSKMPIPWL